MGVEDELNGLRHAVDGCELVAFADIGVPLVLVSSTEGTARRDTLDGLCAEAIQLFDQGQIGDPALLSQSDTAISASANGMHIFLRGPDDPNETICAICAPGTDVGHYLSQARAAMTRMVSGEQGGAQSGPQS